ncbi:class I SAM-dependent methyltransferase [uncultured Tenacibaculum sp.]|uniref:class I SAM-dependent DNA methyltransferase n=1 Tax=uncultured Tenacibaculum sp. TaxID=174713 RepID=UPI002623DACB|nr:class I SAM-dependent methyltransferase [uncultured Tenacibaculum sp.]
MQSLYTNGFENIYDDMYQTFIDYEKEFQFYSEIILKQQKKDVLEIGCGSGRLASHFINSPIHYSGMDLSNEMVELSRSKNPEGTFYNGNMTGFNLNNRYDSIIITARTTSYLLNNIAIQKAIKNISNHLNDNGVLCFDFIDASRFFPSIKNGKTVIHEATINDKNYSRISYMKPNVIKENFMFKWNAKYYQTINGEQILLTEDQSEVRAFTKNEWELFLTLNDFKIIEMIDRKSYAFDTYVVVAQKQ